ncbi:MAG: hypothetical protein LUC45_09350 [Paraprevotella sp.]|nr:hypothetical protein [Paraprevotella sp.]
MKRKVRITEPCEAAEEEAAKDETAETPETEETPADDGEESPEEPSKTEDCLSPIKAFTESEGVEQRPNLSLREILGGDILTASWLRRQMGLILLCMFFAIIYITNRYSAEQEIIEIERLKTELTEVRYRALTRSSELTVKTRQSQIENSLRNTPDSVLQTPTEPPFLIKSQNEEPE